MRVLAFAAVMAASLTLTGQSPTMAAPANGSAINSAAQTTSVVDQVRWWHRHHRHHRHHRRCWWHRHHWVCW